MAVTVFQHMSKVCAKALRLSLRPEAVRCGARGSCRRASGGGRSQSLPQRYLGQPSPHTHPHLIRAGEVTPGLSQAEFAWRRQRLASLVRARAGPGAPPDPPDVIIVLSHPVRYMTNDIPYPFHQNQDFLYLTGILEPDCALVMCGSATPDRTVLLVPRRDPARELWDGPRSGRDGAAALSGVERVLDTDELGALLRSLRGGTVWYDASPPCHPQLHHTHVRPLLDGGAALKPLRALTHSLRAVKSPAELLLMQEAGRITSQAFKKTMAMSRANIDEAVLYAKFDFECRAHGANFLAYPPVVAGGNRANTLHYISNNQLVKDGELVLLDGGCEVFGYVSDVTRSWPVNGRFSAAQAELYEAVLEVQSELLAQCHPGVSLEQLYCSMLALLGRQLKELRLLPQHLGEADALKAARRYCPHHVGHYLGMDVHDTPDLSRSQPLQPHMVITIEPGLYVSEDDCSAPERFRGLGVRIEDDVVIRDTDGPLVLSADTPKTLRQVESACAAGRH